MMIPSREQCWELQKEYNMFLNIKKHSQKVADVGFYIGSHFPKESFRLDFDLLESSALLHDITKVHHMLGDALLEGNDQWFRDHVKYLQGKFIDIHDQWNHIKKMYGVDELYSHPVTGAMVLRDKGYDEVANVIELHNEPLTGLGEADILCYADRIVGVKIVPLEKRFKYIRCKYGEKAYEQLYESSCALEKAVLGCSGLTFEDIRKNA